jgi:IS5 family transposase
LPLIARPAHKTSARPLEFKPLNPILGAPLISEDHDVPRQLQANPLRVKKTQGLCWMQRLSHHRRAERVLTDKGYASKANRDFLRQSKIKSGICHKAVRAHPLSARQNRFNKIVAQRRWKVEQFFGTIKRKFDMSRARYFGVLKVNGQMLLKGICANLVKATNKMEWTPQGILAPKILRMA